MMDMIGSQLYGSDVETLPAPRSPISIASPDGGNLTPRLYSPGVTALGTKSAGLLRSSYQLSPIALQSMDSAERPASSRNAPMFPTALAASGVDPRKGA